MKTAESTKLTRFIHLKGDEQFPTQTSTRWGGKAYNFRCQLVVASYDNRTGEITAELVGPTIKADGSLGLVDRREPRVRRSDLVGFGVPAEVIEAIDADFESGVFL